MKIIIINVRILAYTFIVNIQIIAYHVSLANFEATENSKKE